MRENTLQAEDKGFESAEAVYTYYEMVPKLYTECLDASHQYRLQSKQIQSLCQMYSNSISPGERLREICQKHGERKYTLQGYLFRQGCEKRIETP